MSNKPELLDGKTKRELLEILFPASSGSESAPEWGIDLDHIRNMRELGVDYLRYATDIKNKTLRLGYDFIDKATRGVPPGMILGIVARTAVGKSAIAQNILYSINRDRMVAVFFSLEQSREMCYERFVQIIQGCSGWDVEDCFQNQPANSMDVVKQLDEKASFIYLVDKTSLTIDEMIEYTKAVEDIVAGEKVKCLVVDYLGLIRPSGSYGRAYERVSEVSARMRELAKETDTALIMLHQLSRAAGTGTTAVTIEMLRDSGVVEENMDFIVGAWRPREGGRTKIILSLIKNKRGGLVMKELDFDPVSLRITEPKSVLPEGWGKPV